MTPREVATLTGRSDRNIRVKSAEVLGPDALNPIAFKAEIPFPGGLKFEVIRVDTGKKPTPWRYYFRQI